MRKLRIVQQYVAAKNGGGLETEFRALCGRETLTSEFDLIPASVQPIYASTAVPSVPQNRTLYISGAPESKA